MHHFMEHEHDRDELGGTIHLTLCRCVHPRFLYGNSETILIDQFAIAGYRSIRSIILRLGQLRVIRWHASILVARRGHVDSKTARVDGA
jgi:hypothetical protein